MKRYAKLYFRSLLQGTASLWRLFGFVVGAGAYVVVAAIVGLSLPVAVGVVLLVVIVAGQIGALRIAATAEQQVTGLTEAEVPPEHRRQLHAQLEGLRRPVSGGQPAYYGDPHDVEPRKRAVFDAHFPDLVLALGDWDAAVERKAQSEIALRRAFSAESKRHGLPTSEYDDWEALLDDLNVIAAQRARAGDIGVDVVFEWSDVDLSGIMPPGLPKGGEVEVRLGRRSVAHLSARPVEAVQMRYMNVCRQVEDLYRTVADGSAAVEVRDAYEELELMKLKLGAEIDDWHRVSVFRVSVDCPTCRRNLNLPPLIDLGGPEDSK